MPSCEKLGVLLGRQRSDSSGDRNGNGSNRNGTGARLSADTINVLVRAGIVRIMKKAGRMHHATLMEKLTGALAPRHALESGTMHEAIEYLIDKEYVERADDERETYIYMP